MGRDGSVGLATRYGLDSPWIEFRWGEIFRTRPDQPWGPPSLLYNGCRVSFPGVKRPGRGVNHPPPPTAKVKAKVELYLYFLSGPSRSVLAWNLPLRTAYTYYRHSLLPLYYQWRMLCRESTSVYFENYRKHVNTPNSRNMYPKSC